MAWLSVVMPIHAGAQWLGETLASVDREDTSGIEFKLIDSSEDDACARIAAAFADRLDLSYERRRDVKPWPIKTNMAVAASHASHVAVLHQDDLWLPGRVPAVRKAISEAPDATLLLFPSRIVDASSMQLGTWRCPLPAGISLEAGTFAERMLVQNFVALPAPVMRRDAWEAAGGMDPSLWYTADWDLYLKLARRGSVRYDRAVTTAFRIHPSSLTVAGSRDRADFVDQMQRVVARHADLVPPARRDRVMRRAHASITINDLLAAAARGESKALSAAVDAVLRLGPVEAGRYLRDSRLGERVWPRLRARWKGKF